MGSDLYSGSLWIRSDLSDSSELFLAPDWLTDACLSFLFLLLSFGPSVLLFVFPSPIPSTIRKVSPYEPGPGFSLLKALAHCT